MVSIAEKEGKPVELLVAPGVDPFDAMAQTAQKLQGVTAGQRRFAPHRFRRARAPHRPGLGETAGAALLFFTRSHQPRATLRICKPGALWPEDLDRLHELWLRLSDGFGSRLHHRDVVGVALRRLERDLDSDRKDEALEDLKLAFRRSVRAGTLRYPCL